MGRTRSTTTRGPPTAHGSCSSDRTGSCTSYAPTGPDLHRIPVNLPRGAGALNPSWSPDGAWLVFSMQREDEASIYIVRPDGTRMHEVIALPGQQLQHADWACGPRRERVDIPTR